MKKGLLVLLTLLPSLSLAADKYEKIYSDCIDEAGGINNTVVMECSEKTSRVIKQEMNEVYKEVYERLEKEDMDSAKKLERSQISWLKYRKTHCELMGSLVGSPQYGYCPMELNRKRLLELKEFSY